MLVGTIVVLTVILLAVGVWPSLLALLQGGRL